MNQPKPIKDATGPAPPPDHPKVTAGKIGVLLVNLGTPDATDYWSMRRYLKEFLSDRRVIEVPRPIWWLILNGIILSVRPNRSGAAYRSIWNHELNESPFRTITRAQSEKLAAQFAGEANIIVDWAMRYGQPSIGDRLEALLAAGCDRVLMVPLYPQYSAATTATVVDKAAERLAKMRWQPSMRTLPPYYDDAAYIEALAQSLEAGLAALDFEPELVLASYHGTPRAYLEKGDPYYCHCMKTSRLLRERLGWPEPRLRTTFQSRFGKAEWLKPYTIETVKELARSGVKRLAVITPGFAADCLETLEEIAVENAQAFTEHGGERFALVPCLNDSAHGITMLEQLVRNELKGWI
jgi:ferrochelatase